MPAPVPARPVIVKLETTLWPAPVVIDTDEPSSGGGIVRVIKPRVSVALSPADPPFATWAPAGDPSGSLAGLLILAGLALVTTFAIVGIARSK